MSQQDLQGRVILVAGANGGLGGPLSVELARRGATVVLLGRKVRQLERVYDAAIKTGVEPVIYPLDLEGASPDDYFEMAQTLKSQLGRLDAVVHAAANFEGLTPFNQLDPAKLARALHVNLTAMAWLTQAMEPLLAETAGIAGEPSKVVVMLDDPERTAKPFWGGYGLAQAARRQYVQQHARELGDNAPVRLLGFNPGPLRTMLRSRAYAEDRNPLVRDPSAVVPSLVDWIAEHGVGQGEIRGDLDRA